MREEGKVTTTGGGVGEDWLVVVLLRSHAIMEPPLPFVPSSSSSSLSLKTEKQKLVEYLLEEVRSSLDLATCVVRIADSFPPTFVMIFTAW